MKCLVICVCDGDGGSSLLNFFYTFKTNRPSEEELDCIYNRLKAQNNYETVIIVNIIPLSQEDES